MLVHSVVGDINDKPGAGSYTVVDDHARTKLRELAQACYGFTDAQFDKQSQPFSKLMYCHLITNPTWRGFNLSFARGHRTQLVLF